MDKLNVDFTHYETELTHKFKTRSPFASKDPRKVKSVIPGTIKAVQVAPGAVVNKGDGLLVIETMKMENTILSPLSGVVKAVNVTAGEMIPKDYLLIEIE